MRCLLIEELCTQTVTTAGGTAVSTLCAVVIMMSLLERGSFRVSRRHGIYLFYNRLWIDFDESGSR